MTDKWRRLVSNKVLCSSEGQNALVDQRSGTAPQHCFALGRWRHVIAETATTSLGASTAGVQKHQTGGGMTSVDVAS